MQAGEMKREFGLARRVRGSGAGQHATNPGYPVHDRLSVRAEALICQYGLT